MSETVERSYLFGEGGHHYALDRNGVVMKVRSPMALDDVAYPTETYGPDYFRKWRSIPRWKRDVVSTMRLSVVRLVVGDGAQLLDYGCGCGDFLEHVRRSSYIEAYGYDPHLVAAGCTLPWASCDERLAHSGPWDCVTMFDVLEHLRDPGSVVAALDARTLIVSVPNADSSLFLDWDTFQAWRHFRPSEHLHHFNAESLRAVAKRWGYREVFVGYPEDAIRTNGRQPFPNILTMAFTRL